MPKAFYSSSVGLGQSIFTLHTLILIRGALDHSSFHWELAEAAPVDPWVSHAPQRLLQPLCCRKSRLHCIIWYHSYFNHEKRKMDRNTLQSHSRGVMLHPSEGIVKSFLGVWQLQCCRVKRETCMKWQRMNAFTHLQCVCTAEMCVCASYLFYCYPSQK